MKVSIILAHPQKKSFNHAIAAVACETLRKNGHKAVLHDLYKEKFSPLCTAGELRPDAKLNPVIAGHCREVAEVDGIIVVHPNWWGQPPAILKGWVDRVLRQNIAYKFGVNDKGEGVPIGLLKASAALIFNTANTPYAREVEAFGDPLENLWKKCVFEFCGVKNIHRALYTVVITSTCEQRKVWLADVGDIVDQYFPARK